MEQSRIPKPGEIYNHFKGKLYQIVAIATHTESKEIMVVYQALYGDFKTYVRPLEMFVSEVDHEKYPEVNQKYRFELRVSNEDFIRSLTGKNSSLQEEAVRKNTSEAISPTKEQGRLDEVHKVSLEHSNSDQGSTDMEVNSLLIKFLDAESYMKKLEVLTTNKSQITDRIINDMAVALDCAVDEGPIDLRIQELISCLEAKRRFEDRRMR